MDTPVYELLSHVFLTPFMRYGSKEIQYRSLCELATSTDQQISTNVECQHCKAKLGTEEGRNLIMRAQFKSAVSSSCGSYRIPIRFRENI